MAEEGPSVLNQQAVMVANSTIRLHVIQTEVTADQSAFRNINGLLSLHTKPCLNETAVQRLIQIKLHSITQLG